MANILHKDKVARGSTDAEDATAGLPQRRLGLASELLRGAEWNSDVSSPYRDCLGTQIFLISSCFLWSVPTTRSEEKHKNSANGFPAVATSHSVSKHLFHFGGQGVCPFVISVTSSLRIASSCLSATSVFWYPTQYLSMMLLACPSPSGPFTWHPQRILHV